ncbi:MAG: hypothetical protein ACP5UN_02980 [Candidatus Micrarchaeia archaeon]
MIAVITIVVYEFWYFGSDYITGTNPNASAIIPLLIVFFVSAVLAILMSIKQEKRILNIDKRKYMWYPIFSGIFFALGYYIFYVVINSAGIPAASAFSTAEIVIFTLLLLLSSKDKSNMSFLLVGAVFIAFGMILESLKIEYANVILNSKILLLGIIIAILYGIATYFYYVSLEKIEKKMSTITIMFIMQFIVLGLITAVMFLSNNLILPNFNILYILIAVGIGLVLFFTEWLDATMMKVLNTFGEEAIATGYIISDMQLLPIIVYSIFAFPNTWYIYASGLALIIIGIIFLDWV